MKKITLILCAIVLLAGIATTARAALNAVGPLDAADGWPIWYEDTNLLRLEKCLVPGPQCLNPELTLPNPAGAVVGLPTLSNYFTEWFYWAAVGDITSGILARCALALEGALPIAANGHQTVFARILITLRPTTAATANVPVTVTHPFGSITLTTRGVGQTLRVAQDVGVAAGIFTGALLDSPAGGIVNATGASIGPFLTAAPPAPARITIGGVTFIGDGVTLVALTGGPSGNVFSIAGGGVSMTQPLFTLMGKVSGCAATNTPPVAVADSNVAAASGQSQIINVTANDTSGASVGPPPGITPINKASIAITVPPTSGTAVPNPDGTVTYTPNPTFIGADSFTYTVQDHCGLTSNAVTVPVTVQSALTQYQLTINKSGSGAGTISTMPPATGIYCGVMCAASFNAGQTITLTAAPDAESAFTGWTGCDSINGNQCILTMNGAKVVAALFTMGSSSRGDIDGNGSVNMADAILALQSVSGMLPPGPGIRPNYASSGDDVNGDGKVGLPEVIYAFQSLAGLRTTAARAVTVQGNVVGDAAAALTGAPLGGVDPVPGTPTSVPLTAPVSVVLVDETGSVAASQTVTAANGNFILVVPSGHAYMMLVRDATTGKTISPLVLDNQTGRVTFSLPNGSPDVSFGSVTIDSQLGRAWCGTNPALAETAVAFPLDTIEWRGASDVPTEAPPSPLFGATAFSQRMLLFEEFGPEPMPAAVTPGFTPFPQPLNSASGPDPTQLESFLAQPGVAPYPTRLSNVTDTNPWRAAIETFLGRALFQPPDGVAGPAEGRPPGEDWAHQSWAEFFPQKFFKTAVAPARTNLGFRDTHQRHGYYAGEFAPGGLYHNTAGIPATDGTTNGIAIKFHPNMPVQNPNSVWTFDGTLPPKLLQARYGETLLMRNYDALPIDETANNGFGRNTITTHEHNGHSPGESDGFAGAFFFPGQFYDYHWPLQLAGFSNNNNAAGAVNFGATDVRAAMPCEPGETLPVLVNGILTMRSCQNGTILIPGDWHETMSTHWLHDHMLDHAAENVYKGNASMMNYYSALDRGNEAINDGVNLRFPSGTALNWGNRDYDVNLVLADKATDGTGQLWMNTTQHNGFLGDMMTVNWLYKPYFDVRARSYRFRILNGSVSRIMAIALVQQVTGTGGELPGPAGSGVSYNRVPFHMIANDGNILEHAVPFGGQMDLLHDGKPDAWKGQLPSQGIAERYDIVVDFSKNGIHAGDKLYFVNIMEHQDGKGTKSKVPLADILSERYKPTVQNDRWINGDPGVGKFLELRVKTYTGTDLSMNPADYEPGKLAMLPLPIVRGAKTVNTTVNGVPVATAVHHTFEFVHGQDQGGHGEPWQIKVDGGQGLLMDPHRVQAIENGDLQVWTIKGTGGWTHPVHIHFEEGIILSRAGKAPPEWEKWARKDMYRIGHENDSGGIIEIAYRARDFLGDYVMHSHNTMHQDHAMLLRWDARRTGAALVDTPLPTFDGVFFEPSFPLTGGYNSNDKAIIGDGIGPRINISN